MRPMQLLGVTLLAFLAVPFVGRADDVKPAGALALIPDDAAFAVSIKNLTELHEKGDKLIEECRLQLQDIARPSNLFAAIFNELDAKKGIDPKGSAALVVPNFKRLGIENRLTGNDLGAAILENLVFVVPIDSEEEAAANYRLKIEDLKDGKVAATGIVKQGWFVIFHAKQVALKNKHLYISQKAKAIETVLASKPVTNVLNDGQRTALGNADLAVLFGPRAWEIFGKQFFGDLGKTFKDDDAENDVMGQFAQALGSVRFVAAGLNIDDGLALNVIANLPEDKDGATATKFLSALRGGPGANDLIGLPNVAPTIAYAAKGDGTRNVHMARALLKLVLNQWLGIDVQLTKEERTKFLAAFDTMYQQLRGSRAVIYPTGERAARVGDMAAISILDIANVTDFLDHGPHLVEVANAATPKLLKGGRASSPQFSWKAKAETLDGCRVDWLTIDVPNLPKEVRRDYEQQLGPDWKRLRVAVQGKQVVLLVGSDVDRLRETLTNLRMGSPGLAEHKSVVRALDKLTPQRKVEFHVDFRETRDGGAELSSFALGVEPERIQLEIRAPVSQVRAVLKTLGMARK